MINLNYQTDNYHNVMLDSNFLSPTRCVYIILFNVTNAFSSINWISSILILLSKMAHDSLQTRQRLCRISFERHAGKRNENGIISRLLENKFCHVTLLQCMSTVLVDVLEQHVTHLA